MKLFLLFWLFFICTTSFAQFKVISDEPIYLRNHSGSLVAVLHENAITVDGEEYELTNYPKREKLMKLISSGKIDSAIDLLRKYPPEKTRDLNEPDSNGVTPLMIAAKDGNLDEIKKIYGYGYEYAVDHDGRNAAIYAIENEQWEALELLGKNYFNLNVISHVLQHDNASEVLKKMMKMYRGNYGKDEMSKLNPAKDSPNPKLDGTIREFRYNVLLAAVLSAPDEVCKKIIQDESFKTIAWWSDNLVEFHIYHNKKDERVSPLALVAFSITQEGSGWSQLFKKLPFRIKDRFARVKLLYSMGLRFGYGSSSSDLHEKYSFTPEETAELQKTLDTDMLPFFSAGNGDYYAYAFANNNVGRVKRALHRRVDIVDKEGFKAYMGASVNKINLKSDLISSVKDCNYKMAEVFKEVIDFSDFIKIYIEFADENETMKYIAELEQRIAKERKEAEEIREDFKALGRATGDILGGNVVGGTMSGVVNLSNTLELSDYLECASSFGRIRVIDSLLDLGANIDSCAALECASKNNQCDVLRHFMERGIVIAECHHAPLALRVAQPEAAALLKEMGVE